MSHKTNVLLLALSIALQLALGLFLGHAYDTRINMATGYLVGTGQDPYSPQDLSGVFQNDSFKEITTVGYPPPWPLALGLLYLISYKIIPNLLIYNLAIKLPIIVANILLAYLVRNILIKLGTKVEYSQKAWIFLLFNPFLIYATTAWGQFDSIVALLALLGLVFLAEGKWSASAVLLALAISFKPTALPLAVAAWIFLRGSSFRTVFRYFLLFLICTLVLFVAPFFVFGWDPTPILQHWNVHFTVGGGLSFLAILELFQNSTQLPGNWWFLGLLWVPALAVAALSFKPGGTGLVDLIRKSTVLILVFFLFRSWVSEPNIVLVIPLVLILVFTGELSPLALKAVWILPLVFSFFNTAAVQLLFPSMPGLMDHGMQFMGNLGPARLILLTLVAMCWLTAGSWIVFILVKKDRLKMKASGA